MQNSSRHILHQHGKAEALARGFALEKGVLALRQHLPLTRVLRSRMGVEAGSQKQGMLAVLGLDLINALVEPRHPLNLEGGAKPVKLPVVLGLNPTKIPAANS